MRTKIVVLLLVTILSIIQQNNAQIGNKDNVGSLEKKQAQLMMLAQRKFMSPEWETEYIKEYPKEQQKLEIFKESVNAYIKRAKLSKDDQETMHNELYKQQYYEICRDFSFKNNIYPFAYFKVIHDALSLKRYYPTLMSKYEKIIENQVYNVQSISEVALITQQKYNGIMIQTNEIAQNVFSKNELPTNSRYIQTLRFVVIHNVCKYAIEHLTMVQYVFAIVELVTTDDKFRKQLSQVKETSFERPGFNEEMLMSFGDWVFDKVTDNNIFNLQLCEQTMHSEDTVFFIAQLCKEILKEEKDVWLRVPFKLPDDQPQFFYLEHYLRCLSINILHMKQSINAYLKERHGDMEFGAVKITTRQLDEFERGEKIDDQRKIERERTKIKQLVPQFRSDAIRLFRTNHLLGLQISAHMPKYVTRIIEFYVKHYFQYELFRYQGEIREFEMNKFVKECPVIIPTNLEEIYKNQGYVLGYLMSNSIQHIFGLEALEQTLREYTDPTNPFRLNLQLTHDEDNFWDDLNTLMFRFGGSSKLAFDYKIDVFRSTSKLDEDSKKRYCTVAKQISQFGYIGDYGLSQLAKTLDLNIYTRAAKLNDHATKYQYHTENIKRQSSLLNESEGSDKVTGQGQESAKRILGDQQSQTQEQIAAMEQEKLAQLRKVQAKAIKEKTKKIQKLTLLQDIVLTLNDVKTQEDKFMNRLFKDQDPGAIKLKDIQKDHKIRKTIDQNLSRIIQNEYMTLLRLTNANVDM